MAEETPRSWKDGSLPSRSRVALYLCQEVGLGEKFTMQSVREALPGIDEVDRRMRELREVGWKITTYRDRTDLAPSELRLEEIGDKVWEPGYRRLKSESINARVRRKIFDRDDNRCVVCGIGAGEEYPAMPGRYARMTIGHLVPKGRQGWNDPSNLRTECSMCNEPVRDRTDPGVDPGWLANEIKSLPRADKRLLASWVLQDRRPYTEVDGLWQKYRQLSQPQREEIKRLLGEQIGD